MIKKTMNCLLILIKIQIWNVKLQMKLEIFICEFVICDI